MTYDFSGYATKNDVVCSDGRVIRHDAFKDCDGVTVPLVWQHQHDSIKNILGHALLENRPDGVYAYCSTNDTVDGQQAKSVVMHGDIAALSIYANHLKQNGNNVVHGRIREVSLVLAGANPGALIDNLKFAHGDGTVEDIDDEAIIYFNDPISINMEHSEEKPSVQETKNDSEPEPAMQHADEAEKPEEPKQEGKTIEEIFNSIPEEKRDGVYSIIGAALGAGEPVDDAQELWESLTEEQQDAVALIVGAQIQNEEAKEVKQSDTGRTDTMKFNVFEESENAENVLTHDDMISIFNDAKRIGSLREAVLQHGITDITELFPEDQLAANQPQVISRQMEWVSTVLNSVRKSPFSKVKSIAFNITADDARAKGYIKGTQKVEEQITALKRAVDATTIYKLQKLDRDDLVDITDFDVVAWMKQEMRTMLNEELARAILVGDGRAVGSPDRIDPTKIIPIMSDNSTYSVPVSVTPGNDRAKAFIEACIRARKDYKGSGSPTLFIGSDLLTDLRLVRDGLGYRLYKNDQELADELRVSKIVEIELLDSYTNLGGIIVNLIDYTVGANRGGEVTMFDDFDLDYNKFEYLIETRCSGALTVPHSALVLTFAANSENSGSEQSGDEQSGDEQAGGGE